MSSTPSPEAQRAIAALGLEPHPEGGYYRETFRDTASSSPDNRPASTCIYFLLTERDVSRLHKLDAAETWHLYTSVSVKQGEASATPGLEVVELGKKGPKVTRLISAISSAGNDGSGVTETGPQYTVPAGVWFGSRPAKGTEWVLVGCTVAPGFLFEKFELGERVGLLGEFPACREEIERLTPAS